MEYYRQQGEVFLDELDGKLNRTKFLLSNDISFSDMAIFPFVRQFAFVDKNWFDQSKYNKLQAWLKTLLVASLFDDVMKKYPLWLEDKSDITLL